jgi:predicted amidohydrolase YtcJ
MEDVLLVTGGPILTMADVPEVDAIAVMGGRIRQVGTLADCRLAIGGRHRERDLGGCCLMPGFVEAHGHMLMWGMMAMMADLRWPRVQSIDDIVAELAAHSETLPPGSAVRGFGYDHHKLREGRHPRASELDRVASDRPVHILHMSGHCHVINHFLMRQAGIGHDMADPEGGRLGRDEEGHPDGVLYDNALDMIVDSDVQIGAHAPNAHFAEPLGNLLEMIRLGQEAYLSAGITTAVDAQVTRREAEAYLCMRGRGELEIRVVMMYLSCYLEELSRLGLCEPIGDAFLSLGPLKLYADGSLPANTARFTRPYEADATNSGYLYHTPDVLKDLIVRAHCLGMQTGTHAQGDAGIELVLDAVETAQLRLKRDDVRHRIEHCGFPRRDQVIRMRRLGVWPIPQPRHIHAFGDGALRDLGDERAAAYTPLGWFREYGVPLVLSSDSPVVEQHPLWGVESAVTRQTASGKVLGNPALCLSVAEALRAYTLGAAASVHREHELGSLEPGKFADFIILDRNPLAVPPDEVGQISVQETWLAGRRVHPER